MGIPPGVMLSNCRMYMKQRDDKAIVSQNTFVTERKTTRTHLNQSRDPLIVSIILNNIWQSAAFPYFEGAQKTLEQKVIFQIGTLNPHGVNERFSFN